MELTNISDIKALMERHGIRFQKKYGQNFLVSKAVPERIVSECGAGENDGVLEIGPGIGALTRELCKTAGKVVSVEIDGGLTPVLEETLAEFGNAKIINADIMKTDVKKLVKDEFSGCERVFVCANLPYYITTPVIMLLLECGAGFEAMTFMVQKEVADRLCSSPGTPEYGAITVAVDYYSKAKRLFNVPPGCFIPQPKVSSSVVRLDIYKNRPVVPKDEKLFFSAVRGAFEMRRKTLVNALSGKTGLDKNLLSAILEEGGIDPGIRGEKLSAGEFCRISDRIYEYKKNQS